MITRRSACCMVFLAALITGCASAPMAPATSGQSAEPAAGSSQTSTVAASPTSTVDVAGPTAVAGAASPTSPPASAAPDGAVRMPEDASVLAAGRYYVDDRYYMNASRMTFTVPAGWTADGDLYKDRGEPGEVKFTTWVLTHVFSDVCQWGTLVDAGTTVDEFVSSVMEQEGWEASAPTDVTLGGFPGKRIELTVPADLDTSTCTNGVLRYWPGPGPDLSTGDCCNPPGNTDTVYVIDIDGNRLVAIARHYPGSSSQNRAELQGVIASIEIEP